MNEGLFFLVPLCVAYVLVATYAAIQFRRTTLVQSMERTPSAVGISRDQSRASSAFQGALFCQTILRTVSFVLAFTVSAKDTQVSHLRWVILSDIPGLHFLYIVSKVLLDSQRLYALSSDVCRLFLLLSVAVLGVMWFGIIVVYTDARAQNYGLINSFRLGACSVLLAIIAVFGQRVRCNLHKAKESDVMIRFGVTSHTLRSVVGIISATQLLKAMFVCILVALPSTTNVMVIQKDSSGLDLVIIAGYYLIGELLCAAIVSYRLRCHLKGQRLRRLLEKSWLPGGMEIDPSELRDMVFLASGGYGKVYRADWRGRHVAVKQLFLNFLESPGRPQYMLCDIPEPSTVAIAVGGSKSVVDRACDRERIESGDEIVSILSHRGDNSDNDATKACDGREVGEGGASLRRKTGGDDDDDGGGGGGGGEYPVGEEGCGNEEGASVIIGDGGDPEAMDRRGMPKKKKRKKRKRAKIAKNVRSRILQEQTRRFLLEAEILARLRHPNILRMIGFTHFKQEQTIAIVTEYIAGGSLYDLLHRPYRYGHRGDSTWKPLSQTQEVYVARGIVRGMSFLHTSNVCHRDLKSANVLLTKQCVPQICDFGLAKWSEFSNRTTSAHGTVLWTAPELLLGRECTGKADVFSFAVVLFEIVTRTLPYSSPHVATPTIISQVAAGRLRPTIPADVPTDIVNILRMSWSHEPTKRPSFKRLEALLSKLLDDRVNEGSLRDKDRRRPSLRPHSRSVSEGDADESYEGDRGGGFEEPLLKVTVKGDSVG